ncbi:SAM-dependent methyltransferase, partial [Vibrio parahaemolyticus]
QQSLITELEQSGFRVVTANVYEREEINHITIHAVKVVYS